MDVNRGDGAQGARRRQVKFVGNCQASAMANFYRDQIGTAALEDVHYVDDLGQEVDDLRRQLADADVVVLQERDFKRTIPLDNPDATVFRFPMIVAGFLWPFANEPHVANVAERPISDGPYPSQMSDSFLNRLINKGVSPEDALEQYRALDIARVASLDRLKEIYLDKQRERDEATDYAIADEIDRRFRTERLFLTAEHPDAYLFGLVARRLLEQMEVAKEEIERAMRSLTRSPFPPSELPLHPGVIAHFGLTFATSETRYRFPEEGSFTFDEYVLRYMRYDNNPDLRHALYMLDREDPTVTLPLLEAGLARSPASGRALAAKARLFERIGRREEAFDLFRAAVAAEPQLIETWSEYAEVLLRAGSHGEAELAAQEALALDSGCAPAYLVLAGTQIAQHRFEPAAAFAQKAIELKPGDAGAYRALAIAYTMAGRADEAEGLARRGMTLAPAVPDHRNLVAEILEERARRSEALAVLYEGVASGCSNDQSYSLLGNFHLRDHDLARAEDAFEMGARLYGHHRPDLVSCLEDTRRLRAQSSQHA